MAVFNVDIAQWYSYEVKADSLDEAIEQAINEFRSDMRSPIANLDYDEIIVTDENNEELYRGC